MKSNIEVMKSHFFTRNFIWLLILLFIAVSCQKDSSQVLDSENKPTLADIKELYAKEGIFKKINPKDNMPIQWDPLWNEATVRKANDSVEYMFVPLHPYLKEDKKRMTIEKGGKTYLLVKNGREFYKGFFFNDKNEEITDLHSFSGKMLFTNLKSKAANLIKYRNGSPYFEGDENVQKKRASSTKMAWEQNCSYQTVDCVFIVAGYGCGPNLEIYHSRNCSWPQHCTGYGWSLIDSRDEYVCENVWVPDAPNTDGGGGSDGSDIADFNAKIDDTNLPDCMKGVLDTLKMLDGNSVADMIKKFSGEVPGYNLKFATQNLSDPMKFAVTTPDNNGDMIIGLNTNPLVIGNVSDLAIGATMLHESIHAYLYAFYQNDPVAATMTYPELFEKYSKEKAFSNGVQHEKIAKDFIADLAASMKNYGELKGYHLDKQIYDDIAWKGLLETAAFKSLSDIDKSRIIDRIMSEQYDTRKDKGVTQKGARLGC